MYTFVIVYILPYLLMISISIIRLCCYCGSFVCQNVDSLFFCNCLCVGHKERFFIADELKLMTL